MFPSTRPRGDESNSHQYRSPQTDADDSGTEYAVRDTTEEAHQLGHGCQSSQAPSTANTKDKRREHTKSDMKKTDANSKVFRLQRDRFSSENPDDATLQCQREGKASRISRSWRWDVEESTPFQESRARFHRMSDLFAYHALPVVQQRLGQQAHRKRLRQEMERLLVDMPDEKFTRWIESFQNLKNGDHTMLERRTPRSDSTRHQGVSATPAPLFARDKTQDLTRLSELGSVTGAKGTAVLHNAATKIKTAKQETEREPDKGVEEILPRITDSREKNMSRLALPQSTKFGSHMPKSPLAMRIQPRCRTPIIDLLWGTLDFDSAERSRVVQSIMSRFNQRVAAEHIIVHRLDRSTKIMTKAVLKNRLLARVPSCALQHDPIKVREGMEDQLVPWVVANPSSFPELLSESLIFVNIIPFVTAVSDLLYDPSMSLSQEDMGTAKSRIFDALSKRQISELSRPGPKSIMLRIQITNILENPNFSDAMKRGSLERVLRYVAPDHKRKFPELKSTVLVRTWERETGQTW